MKGAEVNGNVRSEIIRNPSGEPVEFLIGIVFARNDQVGYLDPDIRLIMQIEKCVQNVLEIAGARFFVEAVCKCFQIHVGCIDVTKELSSRLFTYVTGRHGNRLDSELVAGGGDVDGIFEENDRIIVRKRHAFTLQRLRRTGDLSRRGRVGERIDLAGLTDIPILTKRAGKVATRCSEGEDGRTRIKMV
jgi:hypothetical protein